MRPKAKPRQSVRKASGSLQGYAAAGKTARSNLLLSDIRKFVVAEAIRSGDAEREKHRIHVSDLVKEDWCPRQAYYRLTGETPTDVKESVSHQMETIFANGHTAHEKWQTWLWKMGELWGTWKCLTCKHRWEDTSPQVCPECDSDALRYAEVELANPALFLVGHADGAVKKHKALVEIKSFAPGTVRIDDPAMLRAATVKTAEGKSIVDSDALWKSINRPLRAHLLQGLLYLWLCREAGLDFDKMIFIYEWKTTQATKEFVVPASTRLIQGLLDSMTEVVQAVEDKRIPPRPAGFEKDRAPCKDDCVFRTTCWSEENDDTSEQGNSVRTRRRRSGGKASTRTTADRSAAASEDRTSATTRRPHRTDRPDADAADDAPDQVVGVHGDTTGLRGGRRAVRRVRDGQGTSTVVSRRNV